MQRKNLLTILFILLTIVGCYGQNNKFFKQQLKTTGDSISVVQIKTDTIFNSNQVISLLALQKDTFQQFGFEFGYSKSDLKTTSTFAMDKEALAAINGGFFDMKNGGSVTYFEVNDSVVNRPGNKGLGKADSIMNGVIVLTKDNDIVLQPANSVQFYESSKQESAVLVTGPLLLLNSEKSKLPDMRFVDARHPRTCLCETNELVIFITIDGRSEKAEGMSLIEVQDFLLNIGCVNAINLDGGGSTTMWTKSKGIVNFPSDKTGERPVANALLITNRK